MNKRTLHRLLEVRSASVDEAKLALAEALAAELSTTASSVEIDAAIQSEFAKAAADSADDTLIDALANWLPHARARQAEARDRARVAESATARARAALAAALAAKHLVDGIVQEQAFHEQEVIEREILKTLAESVQNSHFMDR